MNHSRYERGQRMLERVDGPVGLSVIDELSKVFPEFVEPIVAFAFGDIYTRPGLDLRQRELAVIAALTSLGTAPAQLKVHVHAALHVGCAPREIVETIIQMSIYAGFPAALNGLTVTRQAFEEAGVQLPLPTAPSDD